MKTKILYISALSLAALMTSCNKAYEVTQPDMDVTAPAVVRVGEKMTFTLDGKADIISFFSGEEDHEYIYSKEDKIIPVTDMALSLTATTNNSQPYASAPNPLQTKISYSKDFVGEYERYYMEKATWIDITDRFNLPTSRNTTTNSGDVVLDDIFTSPDTAVYFRLDYCPLRWKNNNDWPGERTQWTFKNMYFKSKVNGSYQNMYDIYDMDWKLIEGDYYSTIGEKYLPTYPATSGNASIICKCQPKIQTSDYIQFWFITAPIYKQSEINLGRDLPIAIKAKADPTLTAYEYIYTQPGTYTATFVGRNVNVDGSREVVRNVKIEVIKDNGTIGGFEPQDWK